MTGTISNGTTPVGLATFAVVSGLTTKGTLVDFTLSGTAEGHAVGLELAHGDGSLTGHVLDGVLVTKPVGALHCIVEVISPVISVHVTKCGIDATLDKLKRKSQPHAHRKRLIEATKSTISDKDILNHFRRLAS